MSSNAMFGRVIKITVKGKYSTTFSNKDLEIRFDVPFDDDAKPNTSTVDIYNLSKDSINRMQKGDTCTIQAGYKDDYGVIAAGKITKVLTNRNGVDKITTISFLEGDDYSRVKVTSKTADKAEKGKKHKLKIAFKAGTKGSTIIKKLCSLLEIKVSKLSLPKDVTYKKGYTVAGQILNNLEEVVKDCGAALYYKRGKLIIRSIKEGDDERFTLEEKTGLIGSPEPFDDENGKGYKVQCLLQHRLAVASIVRLKSKGVNGKYRVKRGRHYCDGSNFMTEADVI